MRQSLFAVSLLFFTVFASTAAAQDRDTKVRNDRKTVASDESWIYNDLARGVKLARDEKKPLLVVIRCMSFPITSVTMPEGTRHARLAPAERYGDGVFSEK